MNFSKISIGLFKQMPILTKYEKVRILGTRATQIALGAPSVVDTTGLTDALVIAEKELDQRKIPIVVVRHLPNGTIVEIPLADFE